jgi:hypothetical protein
MFTKGNWNSLNKIKGHWQYIFKLPFFSQQTADNLKKGIVF